jgi:hypothetical protein
VKPLDTPAKIHEAPSGATEPPLLRSLTDAEQQELENHLQVGLMVDLLQAKARLSLSRATSRRAAHG